MVYIVDHESRHIASPHPLIAPLLAKYSSRLDKLLSLAPRYGIRVPYQIWACAWWRNPDKENDSYDPTKLVAPLGSAEVHCQFSGILIERDALDIGKARYHNSDRQDVDRIPWAHNAIQEVTAKLQNNKALLEIWKCVDPFASDLWITDNAHGWHHRVAIDKIDGHVDSPASVFFRAVTEYRNRPCLGMPSPKVFSDARRSPILEMTPHLESDGFQWLTYQSVGECASAFARGLYSLNERHKPIAIAGPNSIEWLIADFACALSDSTSIGIHMTNEPDTTAYILDLAQAEILICCDEIANGLGDVSWSLTSISGKCPSLRHVILMDSNDESCDILHLQFPNLTFHKLTTMVTSPPSEIPLPDVEKIWSVRDGSHPVTILFTSGTNGYPKGVIVTVDGFLSDISERVFMEPLVTVSYIPLSHSSDRLKTWEFILNGGRIGIAQYAPSNWIEHEKEKKKNSALSVTNTSENIIGLFRQVQHLRPTAMACPPRILNGVYAMFAETRDVNQHLPDKEIEDRIFEIFGDRIVYLAAGGAHTPQRVKNFIQKVCDRKGISFAESYGATECGAITNNGYPISKYSDPFWVTIRLAPIPSLRAAGGSDVGCIGEIQVMTRSMSVGYFGDPENTARCFRDGWYMTGDIGKWIEQNRLHVIGRVTSATLDAKGHIFCPSMLESFLLSECDVVDQVFVDTEIGRDIRIAVTIKKRYASETDETLRQRIRSDCQRSDVNEEMTALLPDNPSDFVIDREMWTHANGLETAQMKEGRAALKRKYFPQ
jgi:long-chain acyl-CoA synthetase